MVVRTGSLGSDRLLGTNAADVIYGYDPNAGSPPKIAANVIVSESWLGKFAQSDKWSFCLTAARMAAEQEKL